MADDTPETETPIETAAPDAAARPEEAPEPAAPVKGPVIDYDTPETAAPTLKDEAGKLFSDVGGKARGYAEEGKARAGGALDELSKMMNDAADQVDDKLGGQYGDHARAAADAISRFSEQIKNKQIDDLVDDARGFVSKSPAVAIGAAAAIGFVLARILKSGFDAPRPDSDHDRA